MKLSRRSVLTAIGVTGIAAGAAGCGGSPTTSSGDLSMITPIFQDASGKSLLEDTLGGSFDQDVSLSVDYTPFDKLNEKLATSIAGGMSHDIIMTGVGWVQPFAQKQVLGTFEDSLPEQLSVHDKILDTCLYEGQLHALPYQMSGTFFAYNKDKFDQAGIDGPPESLEELRDIGRELQADGPTIDIFTNNPRINWIQFLGAFGGSLFTGTGDAVAFDDGTGEAALQFMIDLIEDGSADFNLRGSEGQPSPFQRGDVAMELIGSATWPTLSEQTPELATEDHMGLFVTPGAEGGDPSLLLGGTLISLGENAAEPELALDFVRHLFTPENLVSASNHTGNAPALTEVPDDPDLAENRFSNFLMENLDYADVAEGGSPAWMEVRELIGPQVESAVTGAQSPAESVANLKSAAEDAIARI